jgi:fibronectin type 3 domain-containing protein
VATAVAEGHKLTWQSVDNAETYNVYRREDWKQYYEELASGLVSVEYIDDEKLPNDTYRYVVTAVNESGESGNSNEVIVVVTSIEDYLVSGSQIETYPNPTDGKLGVRLSLQDKRRVDFRIYDLDGKIVLSKTEMGKEIVTEMELESQTSGVYIMEIEINGTKKTIKIMKK